MTWIPLGPACTALDSKLSRAPVTGAVTCIAFDPNTAGTIYVGTAGGGVWRTTDAGLSWQPLADDQMCLAVGAIAIGPRTGRLYVGTGDGTRRLRLPTTGPMVLKGRGLLVSDDRGDTWLLHTGFADPPSTLEDIHVGHRFHAIVVMPDDDAHIVVATSDGLFESTDGGLNWLRHQPAGSSSSATSLVLDETDPAGPTLYAAVAGERAHVADRTVWRRQGTGPWQRLTTGLTDPETIALALSPTTVVTPTGPRRILYLAALDFLGQVDRVRRSLDGGTTWEDIDSDLFDAARGHNTRSTHITLAVDPEEPESLFLGSIAVLRRKKAETPKWERLGKSHEDPMRPRQFALAFDPHSIPGSPPVLWLGNAGGVWRSDDRGDTWAHRNRGLHIAQLYSLAHARGVDVMLGGFQDNGAQRWMGHPLWRQVQNSNADGDTFSAFDTAIDPRRPGHWYYGTGVHNVGKLMLQHSTDGGDNFHEIGHAAVAPIYRQFAIDPGPASALRARIVMSGMKSIVTSSSSKDGWTTLIVDAVQDPLPTGHDWVSAMTVRGDSLYLGVSSGKYVEHVLETGEVRRRWQLKRVRHPRAAGAPFPPALSEVEAVQAVISSVAVSENRQVIQLGIGAKRHLAMPETTPLVSDGIHLSRVMMSTSGGVGTDMPFPFELGTPHAFVPRGPLTIDGLRAEDNPVNVVVFDPAVPNRVFVGCDVGVFRSEDSGEHYVEWRLGLPNAGVTDIEVEAEALPGRPRCVRVSTFGRGVWERSIDATDETPGPARPDLYLRMHAGFTRRPEPTEPEEPARHEWAIWEDAADLRIQRPINGAIPKVRSTETYAPDGPLDFLGFEALPRKQPRRNTESRLHVQVHNRGPAVARDVQVKLFWAEKSGDGYPALPGNFWTNIGMPMNINVWKPIGDVVVIDRIAPAHPRIATFVWPVPDDVPERVALMALVTCPDDPIVEPTDSPRDVEKLARTDKRVLLTSTKVKDGTDRSAITVGDVLEALAVVVVAGVVVYGTVRAIQDS